MSYLVANELNHAQVSNTGDNTEFPSLPSAQRTNPSPTTGDSAHSPCQSRRSAFQSAGSDLPLTGHNASSLSVMLVSQSKTDTQPSSCAGPLANRDLGQDSPPCAQRPRDTQPFGNTADAATSCRSPSQSVDNDNDGDRMPSSSGAETTDRSVATDTQHPMKQTTPDPIVNRATIGHAASTPQRTFSDLVGAPGD